MKTEINYAGRDGEDGVSDQSVLKGSPENVLDDLGEESCVGEGPRHRSDEISHVVRVEGIEFSVGYGQCLGDIVYRRGR